MKANKMQLEAVIPDEQLDRIINRLLMALDTTKDRQSYKLLTKAETADMFSISVRSLHNWNQAGILKPIYIGNRVYYRSDEVEQALTQNQ